MHSYNTKQRDVLLQYLSVHAHESLTAQEIAQDLEDMQISRSAVYRNLSRLVKDGILKKSASEEGRNAVYRFISAEHCHGKLHMTCRSCGVTMHLTQDETDRLVNFLEAQEGFELTPSETVLYGQCKNCR